MKFIFLCDIYALCMLCVGSDWQHRVPEVSMKIHLGEMHYTCRL